LAARRKVELSFGTAVSRIAVFQPGKVLNAIVTLKTKSNEPGGRSTQIVDHNDAGASERARRGIRRAAKLGK
jgi:hypothetical protein